MFIIETINQLAPTCDVKVSLAQLRKQLERPQAVPSSASSAASGKTQPAVVVDMTGSLLVFEPATIEVKAGQTVVWKNSSREVHTVTADPGQATNARTLPFRRAPRSLTPGTSIRANPMNIRSGRPAHTSMSAPCTKCNV